VLMQYFSCFCSVVSWELINAPSSGCNGAVCHQDYFQ
jgi:hypothetical protein